MLLVFLVSSNYVKSLISNYIFQCFSMLEETSSIPKWLPVNYVLFLCHFPAFITMNLFGQKTSVWIGLRSDDYEKWLNERPSMYSNWSPVEVVDVSISGGLRTVGSCFTHKNHDYLKDEA